MPLFMDRHDVSPAVTAENVAQLHRQDLQIQHLYNCRGLTYWFDEKRGTAFCLVEAPDIISLQKMHATAHGQVPNHIIEVEASIVESFLGRIENAAGHHSPNLDMIADTAFRTVMVIREHQFEEADDLSNSVNSDFDKLNENILKLISKAQGMIVRKSACYFLISFKSVTNAVQCALRIRHLYNTIHKGVNEKMAGIKIALSGGFPVTEKDLLFEDAIKLANRFCDISRNKIMIAREVKDLYNNENTQGLDTSKDIFVCFSLSDEKLLTQLMNFMEISYSNAYLAIDDFTRALGLSRSNLYRKILRLTGRSLNPFIREYRLNESINLLRQHILNLSEIAYQTGFTSLSYFSKCFQKKYGRAPSELLKQ